MSAKRAISFLKSSAKDWISYVLLWMYPMSSTGLLGFIIHTKSVSLPLSSLYSWFKIFFTISSCFYGKYGGLFFRIYISFSSLRTNAYTFDWKSRRVFEYVLQASTSSGKGLLSIWACLINSRKLIEVILFECWCFN